MGIPAIGAGAFLGAAAIGSGFSLIAGFFNYLSGRSADKTNRELAEVARQDQLTTARKAQRNWDKEFAASQQQQQWVEEEADKNRAERTYATGYQQEQNAYDRAANLLSQNYDLWARKTAPFTRGA